MGDLLSKIHLLTKIKAITTRVSEFAPCEKASTQGAIEALDVSLGKSSMRFVKFEAVKSERHELTDAQVIIAGGRGVKGPEWGVSVRHQETFKLFSSRNQILSFCCEDNDFGIQEEVLVSTPKYKSCCLSISLFLHIEQEDLPKCSKNIFLWC